MFIHPDVFAEWSGRTPLEVKICQEVWLGKESLGQRRENDRVWKTVQKEKQMMIDNKNTKSNKTQKTKTQNQPVVLFLMKLNLTTQHAYIIGVLSWIVLSIGYVFLCEEYEYCELRFVCSWRRGVLSGGMFLQPMAVVCIFGFLKHGLQTPGAPFRHIVNLLSLSFSHNLPTFFPSFPISISQRH